VLHTSDRLTTQMTVNSKAPTGSRRLRRAWASGGVGRRGAEPAGAVAAGAAAAGAGVGEGNSGAFTVSKDCIDGSRPAGARARLGRHSGDGPNGEDR